nr:Hpt domain-containing protein [Lachnospiraceae bacterium]
AFEAGNANDAFEAIHTLKGVVGNLGFTYLYRKSSEVTEILRAGSLDVSKELLSELKDEYARVIENVNKL